ncbi:hypothetical protein IMZ31_11940 [Pontibacillus sp. ALD_SL1]|uniref:hypothetical protein n=1 Tax=Pontibacillus sp. ALD_SL1 TaxID=2777185 RepID=UPI001A967065|nr:hypothetical protein [Pontibacillus sp. ALD_SL1]QSS98815.1 hypothetical protein IMZ31_11940 [Pontibacillus sp. ALD_SL1]
MKRKNFIYLILFLFFLVGCIHQTSEETTFDEEGNVGTTSWAFKFVKYNDISYELTSIELNESNVGEKIGEVKRDLTDLDTTGKLNEVDFDAVGLTKGTPLYKSKESNDAIIYKENNIYFIAKKHS